MKIIAKKDRIISQNYHGQQMGQIIPLFLSDDDDDGFVKIEASEYPNNGQILIYSYHKLNDDIHSDYFYIKHDFFINDVTDPSINKEDSNFSLKKITYNQGIQQYFADIPLLDFVPIYSNTFNDRNLKLSNTDKIEANIFFLEHSDEIYGPFERNGFQLKSVVFSNYRNEEVKDKAEDFFDQYSDYDGEMFFKFHLSNIKEYLLVDSSNNKYIQNCLTLINDKKADSIHLALDKSQILNWAEKKLANVIPDFASLKEKLVNPQFELQDQIEELKWQELLKIIKSNELDEKYVENIKSMISSKGENDLITNLAIQRETEFKLEKDKLIEEIEIKGDEILKLKQEIQLLQNSEPTSRNDENIFDKFSDLKQILSNEEEIRKAISVLNLNKSIDRLEAEKDILEKDIRGKERDKETIIEAVEKIKSVFNQTKVEHTSKLAEAKIYTDLLNGIDIIANSNKEELIICSPNIISSQHVSLEQYIIEIQDNLRNQGRDFDFNEVANLVLTISQTFLTILAGAPGVGKTSLADKYSKSLGLSDEFGYLEIPCAKGWNSSKDLIGFYNPLTNKFQSSRTKLREALVKSSLHKDSPYLVLLDEANLSPMEHYWSDFIKLSDMDYPRKIKISDKETIEFGKDFRFLATINHDHTTEVLSNRLIDRASIIQIQRPTSVYNSEPKELELHKSIYSSVETNLLFKISDRWSRNESSITNKLNLIISKLESGHSGIVVSPRKRNAIINYLKIGTGLLKGNDFIALDYAISQLLFPLINMRGDFEPVLEEIRKELHELGMDKSKFLLERIIKRGKEFKHFRYIYY